MHSDIAPSFNLGLPVLKAFGKEGKLPFRLTEKTMSKPGPTPVQWEHAFLGTLETSRGLAPGPVRVSGLTPPSGQASTSPFIVKASLHSVSTSRPSCPRGPRIGMTSTLTS